MAEKETPEIVDAVELEEGSAADTLKPGAGSGGTDSKAETLATFTQLLSQLGKEDLSNLYNRTLEQIGKEAESVPGSADANRSTVAMKPSAAVGKGAWKEDVEEMFAADDLSEEFREKASTVFEAAIAARTTLEEARLQEAFEAKEVELAEAFETKLQEAADTMFAEVSTKLDQYLDYVVEQWMEDNKLAIENSLRSDIAENFISGLQNLFAEHYITVPQERVDIFAEMKMEIDELKGALNESIDKKLELESIINEATKEATFDQISEGLAETQVEKLRTLAEGIEYADADTYRKKLEIVKESYFTSKKAAPASTGLITEEIDGTDESNPGPAYTAPGMDKYVQAIAKSAK